MFHYWFNTFIRYAQNNFISVYLKPYLHIVGPPIKSMLTKDVCFFTIRKEMFYCIRICEVVVLILQFLRLWVTHNYLKSYFILEILYCWIRCHINIIGTNYIGHLFPDLKICIFLPFGFSIWSSTDFVDKMPIHIFITYIC